MLTTVNKVKDYLVMTVDVSKERLIMDLIKQVGKNIESYCNRIFTYGSYTEFFEGGIQRIFLKGFPVWEIEYVKVDEKEIIDYRVDKERGIIFHPTAFLNYCGFYNIAVKYTCGYDAYNRNIKLHPPADLEGAIIEEVVSRYENLTSESRTGENLIDLRTNFLTSRARDYFSRQRIINV